MNPYAIPPEQDIALVMLETLMDRMQAINHLRSRALLKKMPDQRFHVEPVKTERRRNIDPPAPS